MARRKTYDGPLTVLVKSYAGVTTEGLYEKLPWNEWILRRWRVTVAGGDAGRWHRVNYNRLKPVAGLDPDRKTMPEGHCRDATDDDLK